MRYWQTALVSFILVLLDATFNSVYSANTTDLTLSTEVDSTFQRPPSVSGGSVPLSGLLTDLNNGVSFVGNMTGTVDAVDVVDAVLFSDLLIDIENASATPT